MSRTPRYDHAFTLAFSVKSDHPGDAVTAEELLDALAARLADLRRGDDDVEEACGLPFDTVDYAESESEGRS